MKTTIPAESNSVFSRPEIDLTSRVYNIPFKVVGYWSCGAITVYIERRTDWDLKSGKETGITWNVTMTHSSGGREPKEVASDIEAETNFGMTLIAAAEFAKQLLAESDTLEHWHKVREELVTKRHEEQVAAKKARIDADPAIGHARAKGLIAEVESMNVTFGQAIIMAYQRGDEQHHDLVCVQRGNNTWRLFGNRISKAQLIEHLENCSVRTHIHQQVKGA